MNPYQATAISIVLLTAVNSTAWAVNKCKSANGTVTYQEHACESTSSAQNLNISSGRMSAQDEEAAQERLAKIKRDNANFDAMIDGKIRPGMTASQVQNAWGNPSKINKSIGSYGVHEQWVYRNNGYNAQYVYIENGVVKSLQTQ